VSQHPQKKAATKSQKKSTEVPKKNRPPATYDDIGRVLGLALRDTKFRTRLIQNPEAALKHESFGVGQRAIAFFKSLSTTKFVPAAQEYGKRVDAVGLASDMEV
jgi:hypothetical protein